MFQLLEIIKKFNLNIMNTIKKLVAALKNGENEGLIVSERRPGESERAQDKRVEEMVKMFEQEPTKLDKKKLDTLLNISMTAIEDWKKECVSQGQHPACISSFICVDRQTKNRSQGKYMIFGGPAELSVLLTDINLKLLS